MVGDKSSQVSQHSLLPFEASKAVFEDHLWLCVGAYLRFATEVMPAVLAIFPPRTSIHLVSKTMGSMWRKLPAEKQQPYNDAYLADAAVQKGIADRLNQEAFEAKERAQQLLLQQQPPAAEVVVKPKRKYVFKNQAGAQPSDGRPAAAEVHSTGEVGEVKDRVVQRRKRKVTQPIAGGHAVLMMLMYG